MGETQSLRDRPASPLRGSRGIVENVYRAYWPELCRYVQRQFGTGPLDPEEIVQAAFARFAALEHPEDIRSPRAFLYTCSRNLALDHKRRAAYRESLLVSDMLKDSTTPPAERDAESVLVERQQLAIVQQAVETMEPRRRNVLIMHVVHEMTYARIAQAFGISETRVRQLMAEAVALCAAAIRAAEG